VTALRYFGARGRCLDIAGYRIDAGHGGNAQTWLIFSLSKEEINNGTVRARGRSHEGFDQAFSAIVDGKPDTLLVGVILLPWVSGPIQGFAG